MQLVGGEVAARASEGLALYAPTADTPDATIRVLEMPGVKAFWHCDLAPTTPAGFARRRHALGEGPWFYEPDSVSFPRSGGLRRALVRRGNGVWSGRIQIPDDHPLFDRPITTPVYGTQSLQTIGSHPCTGQGFRVYGFICDAPGDSVPHERSVERLMGGPFVYRNVWFAARELERLTRALHEAAR